LLLATTESGRSEMSVQMTQEQAAKELGISLATVERTWAFARAWLFRDIEISRNVPS
jgi:predicted DNA-binding protein (UPF0251 family)